MLFYLYFLGWAIYSIFNAYHLLRDNQTSSRDPTSWQVIIIAGIIWPIAAPLSYYELKARKKRQARLDAMPKPTTMSDGSIRYIKKIEPISTPTKAKPIDQWQEN